jgi:general secretion pathway protein F
VLKRLSDFMFYQIDIKRKFIGALVYPALMMVAALGITVYLFVSVLPKITKSFATLKVTLPWYTLVMNEISRWMQAYWLFTLTAVIISTIAFLYWSKTPKGRYKVDTFLYTAPIVGALTQRVAVSRFSKTLSTVLSAGVRIVEGLQLTRNVVGNALLEEAIDSAIVRVQDGEKLAAALEKTGRFPTMVCHMLRTGEKTGKLEDMLTNIAEVYDDEVDAQVSITTRLLQPIILIFMAGVVLLIVMSVLGPMMQAMNQIK